MQEIHAISNGDGTYTVQIVGMFREGVRQLTHPRAYICTDGLVLDEIPSMQQVHFQFGNQAVPPEVFQQFVKQVQF